MPRLRAAEEKSMSTHETPRFILGYSTFFKFGARLHLALCVFFALISLVAISSAIFNFPKSEAGMAGNALAATLVAVVHCVLYFKFTHPFASARYLVFTDRLELHRGTLISVAKFAEIKKMYGRVFPFVAGAFGFVLADGRSFHFGAAVKDSHRILEAISDFNPTRGAELDDLRKDLILLHRGYERFLRFLGKNRFVFGTIHLFIIPFAFSAYLVSRQAKLFTIADPLPYFVKTFFLIFLAIFVLASFISFTLNRWLDLPNAAPDPDREKRMFRDAIPIYFFAVFTILGAYQRSDLNALGRVEITTDFPHLGIEAGQEFWVDQRANCVACAHALYPGDIILFKSSEGMKIGKLVDLPPKARAPAATPEFVIVRFDANGGTLKPVALKDIVGRTEKNLADFLHSAD